MNSDTVFNKFKSIQFKNENEMNEYVSDINHSLYAGIVFESDDYLQYTIRINSTYVPDPTIEPISNYAYGRYQLESQNNIDNLYLHSFVPLQALIDQSIIRLKTNDDTLNVVYQIGKLGKPQSEYSYSEASTKNNISYNISSFFIMSVIMITINLVQEKENKIKESLLMAGVHPTIFWLSWLCIYILFSFITSIIVILLFYLYGVTENLNLIIIFFAIFFYGLSCCNLAFLFSTLFEKVRSAGTAISYVILILIFCNLGTSYVDIGIRKILSFFFSTVSIGSFM